MAGTVTVANSIIAKGKYWSADVPAYTYDIDKAKQILEDNNAVGTELRLGYIVPNPRRESEAQLIVDACGPKGAGFDVKDEGDKTFFNADGALVTGNFDVALFAWTGSPLVTGSSAIYTTDGGSNYGNYSNKKVDALTAQLNKTTDPDQQVQVITQIETILWNDLATIPAFAFPGIVAYDANATGVEYNATQSGLTWNMEDWSLAGEFPFSGSANEAMFSPDGRLQ